MDLSQYRQPDWSDLFIDVLHHEIAIKLERNPRLLGIAVENLKHWRTEYPDNTKEMRRWKIILMTWEFDEILELLRSTASEARRLKRLSPFCGLLTPEEIGAVLRSAKIPPPGLEPAS